MLQNGYWCSVAVQIVSEPEISQGAEFELRADARTLSGAKGGCKNLYESVLSAGALPDCRRQAGKAKSVTNNLPILSVLCGAFFLNPDILSTSRDKRNLSHKS